MSRSSATNWRSQVLGRGLSPRPSVAPRRGESPTRRSAIVLSACALPNAILVSYINLALPDIQATFRTSAASVSWVASGYITAGAAGAVVAGRAADVFGLRRSAITCLSGFAATSVGVALAPSLAAMIILRVVEGGFGMSLASLAIAAIARRYKAAERVRVMGIMLVVFGAGLIIGSLAGGVVIDALGWRVAFAAVGLASLILGPAIASELPGVRVGDLKTSFDFVGGAIAVSAIVATLIWFNRLGRYPSSLTTLIALGVAVVGWPAFWWWINHADRPFVAPAVLRDGRYMACCGLASAMQALFVGCGFVLPLVLHDVFGWSSGLIGVLAQPGFVALAIGGLLARHALNGGERIGPAYWACLLAGLAGIALFLGGLDAGSAPLVVTYAIFGGTYALAQTGLTALVSRVVHSEYQATGLGFFTFAYFAAGSLAVSAEAGIASGRHGASSPLLPWLHAPAKGFSDSFVVLAVCGLAAIGLSLALMKRVRST